MEHKFKAGRRGKPAKDMPCVECGVIWANHDRPEKVETPTVEVAEEEIVAPEPVKEETVEEKQARLLDMIKKEKTYDTILSKVKDSELWDEDGDFEKAYWARKYRMSEKDYAKFEIEQEAREEAKKRAYLESRTKLVAELGLQPIPYPLGSFAYYA